MKKSLWDSFYESFSDEGDIFSIYMDERHLDDVHLWVPQHFHNACELVYIAEGEYLIHLGNDDKLVKEGEIIYIDSLIPHWYSTVCDALVYVIVFDKRITDVVFREKTLPAFMEKTGASDLVRQAFERAGREWNFQSVDFKKGFTYGLLGTLMQFYPLTERKKAKTTENFVSVLKYIEENFRKELTLEKLSSEFGYTTTYFSRLFNKTTGVNLREYINRRRIREVLVLLEQNEGMSLSKASTLVGYTSWNTFYRAYTLYGVKHEK